MFAIHENVLSFQLRATHRLSHDGSSDGWNDAPLYYIRVPKRSLPFRPFQGLLTVPLRLQLLGTNHLTTARPPLAAVHWKEPRKPGPRWSLRLSRNEDPPAGMAAHGGVWGLLPVSSAGLSQRDPSVVSATATDPCSITATVIIAATMSRKPSLWIIDAFTCRQHGRRRQASSLAQEQPCDQDSDQASQVAGRLPKPDGDSLSTSLEKGQAARPDATRRDGLLIRRRGPQCPTAATRSEPGAD
jgi:hypothetical protein